MKNTQKSIYLNCLGIFHTRLKKRKENATKLRKYTLGIDHNRIVIKIFLIFVLKCKKKNFFYHTAYPCSEMFCNQFDHFCAKKWDGRM